MTTRPINGTQKADVYSFAIILQEIMFRAEPYFLSVDPPQRMYSVLAVLYFSETSLYGIHFDIFCDHLAYVTLSSP